MSTFERLLQENEKWAADKVSNNPDYFVNLAKGQKPKHLYIGCSDSRVPIEVVVNAEPGEIFIHRNIANQVIATDFSCLSVVQYAVEVLNVENIIVCGHYGCGGVRAAMNKQNKSLTITNKWLMHIKQIYRFHEPELDALESDKEKFDRLVELNVIEQARNLTYTSIVQKSWKELGRPVIHAVVFALDSGRIQKLDHFTPDTKIPEVYRYA